MKTCYLCNDPFTATNTSKEHIILNSIGGHLKSKELLCRTCNSKFGEQADKELSKQLSFFASLLQIKRDEGENQIIKGGKTKNGEEIHLVDGSKPVMSKPQFNQITENGEVKYSITARNEEELLNILKGLRKKHPELDLEDAKQKFRWNEKYFDEPISYNTTIGGDFSFRSITKTAVNYYIHTQKDSTQVKHLFEYLKDKEDLKIAKHFHPVKPAYKREGNEVIHLIHLVGIKHSKLLYCFIEFFSSYSFLVLLSDKYEGKNISSTYAYNVLKAEEIEKNVKLKLTAQEVKDFYSNLNLEDFKAITEKLNRVMAIAQKIQTDKEASNITQRTIERVFNKYKHEPKITEQMINELSHEIALAYVKFMHRGNKD